MDNGSFRFVALLVAGFGVCLSLASFSLLLCFFALSRYKFIVFVLLFFPLLVPFRSSPLFPCCH